MRSVTVTGMSTVDEEITVLLVNSLEHCTESSNGFEHSTIDADLSRLELGPYSVLRITASLKQ